MKENKLKHSSTANYIFEINGIIDKINLEDKVFILPKIVKHIGQSLMADLFRDFFEKNPNIQNFSWTQYTPSWNDGDACTFRANFDSYSLEINGVSGDKMEDFVENKKSGIVSRIEDIAFLEKELNEFNSKIEEYKDKRDTVSLILNKELLKNKKAIEDKIEKAKTYSMNPKLFSEIETTLSDYGIENIAEQCFGNNVKVTCHSDGRIEMEDYDCGY